ncbi:MAG: diguanylate cyclase [Hydrogenovibrio sp.]
MATALLISFSLSIPFFQSAKQQIEQVNLTSAKAQAAAINNQLARYQSLAKQFTSRTEIRKRLEAYLDGQMTLAETQAYSYPRLLEPMKKTHDLDVMIRITKSGEPVVSLNRTDHTLPPLNHLTDISNMDFINMPDSQTVWVAAEAAIVNSEHTVIGQDILLFDGRHLQSQLGQTKAFAEPVSLHLVNVSAQQFIAPDPQSQYLLRQALPSQTLHALQPLNLQQPQIREWDQDGIKQVGFYVPLSLTNWGLLVSVPSDTLYQTAYNDLTWAFASVVLMLIITLLITHRAVRPVMQQLYQKTREIESKSLELKLAASVFDHTKEAIVITDAQQRIVRANKGFYSLTGISSEQAKGAYLIDYLADSQLSADLITQFEEAIEKDNAWQGEIWYKKSLSNTARHTSKNAEHDWLNAPSSSRHTHKTLPVFQSISAVRDHNGQLLYYIHICNDISERKAAENRIKYLAHNDGLTGLPNRNALMSLLHDMVNTDKTEESTFTVMFLDLDHFKPVNDRLGHAFGDQLLKAVAERLQHHIRESDVAGLLGGDEFLLIIRHLTHLKDAEKIAKNLTQVIAEPYELDGLTVRIGASIGIAHYPQDAQTVDALIQYADADMYRVKRDRLAAIAEPSAK